MKIASVTHVLSYLARTEKLKTTDPYDQYLEARRYAIKLGYGVHRDGRLYISHSRGTPKGMRWQNGHLIPRR